MPERISTTNLVIWSLCFLLLFSSGNKINTNNSSISTWHIIEFYFLRLCKLCIHLLFSIKYVCFIIMFFVRVCLLLCFVVAAGIVCFAKCVCLHRIASYWEVAWLWWIKIGKNWFETFRFHWSHGKMEAKFSWTCCLFCQLFSEAHKPEQARVCVCVYVRTLTHSLRCSPPARFRLFSLFIAILLKRAAYNAQAHSSTACMHARIHASERLNKQACVLYWFSHYTSYWYTQQIHAHAQGNFHPFQCLLVCVCKCVFECHSVVICLIKNTQTHTHSCAVLSIVCDEALFIRCHFGFLRQTAGPTKQPHSHALNEQSGLPIRAYNGVVFCHLQPWNGSWNLLND